ncbi:MAG: hypothetical protein AB2722_21255 [Candidatus Thiodiazotropha sp.]
MRLDRKSKNLISEEEAKVLCSAIEERGELSFPLSSMELGAVTRTVLRAQREGDEYSPSIREKLAAKWNFSYASVASFILWLGANNVSLEPEVVSSKGEVKLKVKLQSNNQIEWDALKATAFRAPLI